MNKSIRFLYTSAFSFILALTFIIFLTSRVAEAAPCQAINHADQTPAGYASPVSYFTNDLMIKGDCLDTGISVVVGSNRETTYVYNTSYRWDGSSWQPITLSGNDTQGAWIPGTATANYASTDNPSWFVAYTCEWIANAWRCGCTTQQCTQNQWQVQAMVPPAPPTPGGGSGGGSSQGGAGTYTGDAELVAPSGGADGNPATPNVNQCINSPTHNYLKTMPTANPRASLSNAAPCSERYQVAWQLELRDSDIGRNAVDVLRERYGNLGTDSRFSMGSQGLGNRSVTIARGPGGVLALQRNVEPGIIPNTTYQFDNFPQGAQAICISMQVYIPSDFRGNEIGSYKLGYGVWGGPHADGGGISPLVQRDDSRRGWVVRNVWNGRTTNLYQYHLNRGVRSNAWGYCDAECKANDSYRSSISDSAGCRLFGDTGTSGEIPKGRWVRIEEEVVGNSSPTSFDGYSRLWIDGRQIGEVTGQHFGSMPIRGLFVNDMWGGSITAPQNQARTSEKYWLASYAVYN